MSILRADSIRDRAGTGAPNFPNGATVTGVITATSFSGSLTGNATGLTGTPSITVQDATVQGNLTVNGTTSTIDTVITAVDSLAVDGQITGLGNLGIGTDNPVERLHIAKNSATGPSIYITNNSTGHTSSDGVQIGYDGSNNAEFRNRENTQILFYTNNTERVQITGGGTAIFKGGLAEKFHGGTTLQADNTLALTDGNLVLRSSNETGAQTVNFTGIHNVVPVNHAVSYTVIITPNGSGYINAVQVDGVAQTIQWSGGSAPSAGASGRDVYTFTILRTGSTTTDYEIFGAATNYA